jgi:hypothetical protein
VGRGVYARPSVEQRFRTKVDTSGGMLACWPYLGAPRGPEGYGAFWLGGRQEIASRVAFILANGPLDDDQVVRHTCDNVECCNPLHLIAGVQADNIADKVARRRQATGERVGTSRLTEDQVAEIRRRHTGRRGGQRLLAHEFGVSETVISGIVRGQSWRAVA